MNKDEKDKEGKYIRQERYAGAMSRSYYVGQDVTQEDVKAKFEDGILKLTIPRMDKRSEVEQRKIFPSRAEKIGFRHRIGKIWLLHEETINIL